MLKEDNKAVVTDPAREPDSDNITPQSGQVMDQIQEDGMPPKCNQASDIQALVFEKY